MGCHCLLPILLLKAFKSKLTPPSESESESEVAQLCPTLSNPMDCSLPGSSVHGIFQARILEWGAIAFSHIYAQACLNNWLLANFGMLRRAPETSQREILNNLSSFGMWNYMGSAVRKRDESSQVILYGGCYWKV